MATVIHCSVCNVSLCPRGSSAPNKEVQIGVCHSLSQHPRLALNRRRFLLPQPTFRLFYGPNICLASNYHSRSQIRFAVGTDVTVDEDTPASSEEASDSSSDATGNDSNEISEPASAQVKTLSAATARAKRARPGRKSEMPPVKDEDLVPGASFSGKIRAIQPFGVFVDFGAFTDGLVHISRVSDTYVKDVASIFSVGQEVTVRVVQTDRDAGRISLTMRTTDKPKVQQKRESTRTEASTEPSWKESASGGNERNRTPRASPRPNARKEGQKSSKFVKGQTLNGTVKSLTRAGAYVTLPEGEEGFLPVSEESDGFDSILGNTSLQVGQEVTVRVLRLSRGQATLTMKQEIKAENSTIQGVVHVATNPFQLAFRRNKELSAFLVERGKSQEHAGASDNKEANLSISKEDNEEENAKTEEVVGPSVEGVIEEHVDEDKIEFAATTRGDISIPDTCAIENEFSDEKNSLDLLLEDKTTESNSVEVESKEDSSLLVESAIPVADTMAEVDDNAVELTDSSDSVLEEGDVTSVSDSVNEQDGSLSVESALSVVGTTAEVDGAVELANSSDSVLEVGSNGITFLTDSVGEQDGSLSVESAISVVDTMAELDVPSDSILKKGADDITSMTDSVGDESTLSSISLQVGSESSAGDNSESVELGVTDQVNDSEITNAADTDSLTETEARSSELAEPPVPESSTVEIPNNELPSNDGVKEETMVGDRDADLVIEANDTSIEASTVSAEASVLNFDEQVEADGASNSDVSLAESESVEEPIAKDHGADGTREMAVEIESNLLDPEVSALSETQSEPADLIVNDQSAEDDAANGALSKDDEITTETALDGPGDAAATVTEAGGEQNVSAPGSNTKASISPALVKQLREDTGAGMMDCKKALAESGGDIVKALEFLRKKGLATADKRAGRATSEGRIASYVHDNRIGVLIEVNCETDFVSRNDMFKELVDDLAMQVAACPQVRYLSTEDIPDEIVNKEKEIEMQKEDLQSKPEQFRSKIVEGRVKKTLEQFALLEQPYIKNDKVLIKDWVKEVIATVGENMKIRRFVRYNLGEGLAKKSGDFAAEVAAQTAARPAAAVVTDKPAEVKEAAIPNSAEISEKKPAVAISAALVKQLREETGAGMMDCKKALAESEGDLEKAQEYLRKKGLSSADKKSSRLAAEGIISSYIHDNRMGCLIEVNSETDFVARNEKFKELVNDIAMQVVACPQVSYVAVEDVPESIVNKEKEIEMQRDDLQKKPESIRAKIVEGRIAKRLGEMALLEQPFIKDDSKTVKELVKEAVASLGENIKVRRFVRYTLGEST